MVTLIPKSELSLYCFFAILCFHNRIVCSCPSFIT